VKNRLALIAMLLVLLAALTGCSQRHKIEIQSDVCWDAVINGDQHLNDCGNVSYKVTGKLNCIVVQKQTANGYLRVRIDGRAWTETTEQFGLLQVCN
jgi:hypothetical protein